MNCTNDKEVPATDELRDLRREVAEAHKALDVYGVARGAGGYSIRYRIGLLSETLPSASREMPSEPTLEMIAAFEKSWTEITMPARSGTQRIKDAYKAMRDTYVGAQDRG